VPPEVVLLKVTALDTLTALAKVAPPELVTDKNFKEPPDPKPALEDICPEVPEFNVKPEVAEIVFWKFEIAQASSFVTFQPEPPFRLELILIGNEEIPDGVVIETINR
jgi:hypothetical protein